MSKYDPDDVASYRNFIILKKIRIAIEQLLKEDNPSIDDKNYIKYQLLKKYNSYDLKEMNFNEFKKEVMKIIGG